MRIFLLLLVIVAIVEGFTFYLALNNMNPYWVHHLYMPIEYSLIALVFSFWQKELWARKLFRLSIPVFVLLCLWDIFVVGNLRDLNAFTASIAYTLYVGMSAYTLINIERGNVYSPFRDYRFWIGTALLVYSAGGLAYFSFHGTIVANFLIEIWAIHAILNIIAYVLYSVGFICQVRLCSQAGP